MINNKKLQLKRKINQQKQQVLQRINKKIYLKKISLKWINTQGHQCKIIVPENKCFCSHSLQSHQTNYSIKPFCKIQKCDCRCFQFIPHFQLRCFCKHSYKNHNINDKKCQNCTKCTHFISSWACSCGFKYNQHSTKIFDEIDIEIPHQFPDLKDQFKNKSLLKKSQKDFMIRSFVNNNKTIQLKNDEQLQVNNSHSHVYLKQRLVEANQRCLKLKGMLNDEESKKQFKKQNNSILNVDYSQTALQLILTPHKYRYLDLQRYSQFNKHKQRLRYIDK